MSTVHARAAGPVAGPGAEVPGAEVPGAEVPGVEAPVDPASFPVTSRHAGRGAAGRGEEVGDGPFGRAVTAFAWGAGLTLLLAAANLPLVVAALLLRPEPSLLWLVALAALPLGPALSAALYAVRSHYVDPDVPVARAFARGYRLNRRDASVVWVPGCLLGGVLAVVAVGARAAGVPALVTGLALGAAALLAVLTLHALALRTFFGLRAVDAVLLAGSWLVARPRASLGTLLLVVGAAAVAVATSDLLLVLLGGVAVWLWYRAAAGSLREAGARFLPARLLPTRPTDTTPGT